MSRAATKQNATFCLDRAVTLIGRKQMHHDSARWIDYRVNEDLAVKVETTAKLFKKAEIDSEALAELEKETIYRANSMVPGLDGTRSYTLIAHIVEDGPRFFIGYVDSEDCDLLKTNVEE